MERSEAHTMEEAIQSAFPIDSGHLEEDKLRESVAQNPGDFDAWTSLIKEVEKTTPNDVERIFSVYDAFLSEFPLCYGYWKKYADHKGRLCTINKVVEVYERAVQSATYSVGLWVNYCCFGVLSFEDPADIRRLFERGLSFVGKDYLCHLLWDKYIEFEYSQKQWSRLTLIYLRTLRFPTKKLRSYHESFKRLVAFCEEEMKHKDSDGTKELLEAVPIYETTEVDAYKDKEISTVSEDLRAHLQKYLSAGEHFYQKASDIDSKIKCFESRIRRPHFHIKPLDDVQLDNWHHYLDFVEVQGDFDWIVKLYERCLNPCANYPEFWIRYVECVEAKGGREIANLALVRATDIFLKRVQGIHLFSARFKEQIGDIFGARAAFLKCCSNSELDFIENVKRKANLEKRQGNVETALIIYEKALEMGKEKQDSHTLGILYAQFSQFKYMVTASIDAARDILIEGIQHLPRCKLLLEKLIHFEMMHGGPKKINVLDSIIAEATAPRTNVPQGLSANDCEEISSLFLEFVDLCGSMEEIKKAWDRHTRLFPYKRRPTSSSEDATSRNGSLNEAVTRKCNNAADLTYQASVYNGSRSSNDPFVSKNASLEKTTDVQADWTSANQSKLEETKDVTIESSQQLQTTILAVELPRLDAHEQNIGPHDSLHECSVNSQALQDPAENFEVGKQVETLHDLKPQDGMVPPALENLSINPQEDEIQQSNPTASLDIRAPPEATSVSNGNRQDNGSDTIKMSSVSNPTCMQPNVSLHSHLQHENGQLWDPGPQEQLQPQAQTDPQNIVHSTVSGGNCHQSDYHEHGPRGPSSLGFAQAQPQQLQVSPQPQYTTAEMQSHMITGQGYPCQPQPWQSLQRQQTNQSPSNYHGDTGYVYPTGNHIWTAQNVQPPALASGHQTQPSTQPVSHSQAQLYQYPFQSSQPYPHIQSNQGSTQQMWHYYQPQPQPQQLQQYPLPQQQQWQQQLPQQQLHPMQQVTQQQQYHQQPHMQMWNNYYAQHALPVQYHMNGQPGLEYGQQAPVSQGQTVTQQNGEGSSHVHPQPLPEAPASG